MNTKRYQNLLYKEISYQIQGAAIEVRKNFGPGLKETIYQNAFAEELKARNIKFNKETSIQIFSPKTGRLIGSYRPDFIAEDKILIELKAVEKIPKMFLDQIFSYLRNSKYELGYFINFASPKLYIKRLIFTNDRKPFIAKLLVPISLIFVLFSVLPTIGQAAQLNFISPAQEIGIGQQFQVDLFLDTEGEAINAVAGKIMFPADLLEMKEIRDGNSIVNFWLERPALNSKSYILYSGIIPGGYQETKGFLLSVVFRAKASGSGTIEISDAKVLLNDGEGTLADLSIFNFQFSIAEEAPVAPLMVETVKDIDPPEEFKPEIVQSPEIFEGKYFLVFATQDKSSGVAYYAIHETTRKITRINTKGWTEVESPYVLKDQKLRSYIYVKAIDKAGNERIAVVPPKYPLKWYENYWIWAIIVLVGIIFYIVRRFLWRKLYTKIHK